MMDNLRGKLYLIFICLSLFACDNSDNSPSNNEGAEQIEKVEVRIVDWSNEEELVKQPNNQNTLRIADPYSTIVRIFSSYIEYQESTDSEENKDSLRYAIREIGNDSNWIDTQSLQLLLNVWMYYDPTDFSTRDYVEQRLKENKSASVKAVNHRMQNKEEWENKEYAPFSELSYLKNILIKSDID